MTDEFYFPEHAVLLNVSDEPVDLDASASGSAQSRLKTKSSR